MIKVAGNNYPWHEGMTVADLLREIDDPRPYAVVRINDLFVSRPNFAQTTIPDESEVYLIPMIAGG
ncbi:MAG: sulfur carrier protein ThiS [Desulfobacterales bacterium]|nr:MAG: sulfur carrier protein ThiS [Desulfobacterales bacterium]